MKLYRYEDMKGGWFVGAFTPTAFHTDACEVSLKVHPKGERWPAHYHRIVTEVNLLIDGVVLLQDRALGSGDIFVLDPYEVADPTFLSDCRIVCVKLPGGIGNDKVIVEAKPS